MATKSKARSSNKPVTKSEVINTLCEKTGLKRAQVNAVFEGLFEMASRHLGKNGAGVFALPGLLKFTAVVKPATPAGMRPNPFRPGEMMEVKAKPARRVVRARPLKALKDAVM